MDVSIDVMESEDVYPPSEDTWLLLEAIDLEGATRFADVGTGTGIIALHAAKGCRTVATDVNPYAVALCRRNADSLGLPLEVVQTDLLAGLRGTFDVIAFNPPYLPSGETSLWIEKSWSGGLDGNEVILRFLEQVGDRLAYGGRVYLLLSSHNRRALTRARQLFHARPLVRKPLFFEEIVAVELRSKGAPGNNL